MALRAPVYSVTLNKVNLPFFLLVFFFGTAVETPRCRRRRRRRQLFPLQESVAAILGMYIVLIALFVNRPSEQSHLMIILPFTHKTILSSQTIQSTKAIDSMYSNF